MTIISGFTCTVQVSNDEARHNARLIAAAPDLLAVLKDVSDIIRDCDGGNSETETGWASEELLDMWMRVNAAIAKAEGKS
jgi:hypothetical protein